MKPISFKQSWLISLLLVVSACGPTIVTIEPAVQTPSVVDTPTPAPRPTNAPEPTKSPISFEAATYRDETASFELDYPADWTLDPSTQVGVRGAQALLLSPGTTSETLAEGGSRIALIVYTWDPKHDLDAYVAQRKTAWEASGFVFDSEETWELADGRQVQSFSVHNPDQAQSFFAFTTVGEDYLQLSGESDLALIEEIAHTLRPLNTP